MINSKQKARLLSNWEHRETLTTNAEVRIHDPNSEWQCYLIAMNPQNDDEVYAMVVGWYPEVCMWELSSLMASYNEDGEHPIIDNTFRPCNAGDLLRKLKDNIDGYKRD